MNKSIQNPWTGVALRLSWDAIFFIALWAAQSWTGELAQMVSGSRENNVSLIVSLLSYLNLDPLPGILALMLSLYIMADLATRGRVQVVLKVVAIAALVLLAVVLPTLAAISFRHHHVPYLYVHDGAIQVEEAIKFLVAGRNPYAESYVQTPMAQWPFHETGVEANPALYHLPYLPMLTLSSMPFYGISQLALGWYDQRFVYLFMLMGSMLLVWHVADEPARRLVALMVVALNPLFVTFFVEGRNDIVVSFWLLGSIVLMQRGRMGWAVVLAAAAVASKQTAWFFAPFLVVSVLGSNPGGTIRDRIRPLLPGLVVLIVALVPFLAWNAGALIDDTIKFQSGVGMADAAYPIKSVGLGSLVVGFGWVSSRTDAFPFGWFQVVFGGATLIGLLYRQWRNNSVSQMVLGYGLLLCVASFFSRTFNDNHLGFALTWLVLSACVSDPITETGAERACRVPGRVAPLGATDGSSGEPERQMRPSRDCRG